MMEEESGSTEMGSGGIGVLTILGLIFITLKLCNVINWSWWYVTLPFWGVAVGGLLVIAVVLGVLGVSSLFRKVDK